MKLQGNDKIEDIAAIASSSFADEAFVQNGFTEEAEEHTDEWYHLQEGIREAILSAVYDVVKEFSL